MYMETSKYRSPLENKLKRKQMGIVVSKYSQRPDGFWQIDEFESQNLTFTPSTTSSSLSVTKGELSKVITREQIEAEVSKDPYAKYIIGEGAKPTTQISSEQKIIALSAYIYLLPYYLVKTNVSALPTSSIATAFITLKDGTGFLFPKYIISNKTLPASVATEANLGVNTELMEYTPQAAFNYAYAVMQPGSTATESDQILYETPPPTGWIPTMSPCPTGHTCLVPIGVETDKVIVQLETKTAYPTTLYLPIGAVIYIPKFPLILFIDKYPVTFK
ncbi:hypothetical protein BDK51DRAFT_32415 [Blyttiomyces helicus]|uniref:Uncharacterized protein n=1 Tax=Blyttiomyces helicus TaxID=388810 RepID=A0A4P9WB02_9FUNG|nr:hypothetical protein BDK51DRAFT_32415 [Blyttiomyces helicus]|eukprot:RKO88328.1 hypothetical protein BDK51DRAFT_32415 [Blyttiomyces helicus]